VLPPLVLSIRESDAGELRLELIEGWQAVVPVPEGWTYRPINDNSSVYEIVRKPRSTVLDRLIPLLTKRAASNGDHSSIRVYCAQFEEGPPPDSVASFRASGFSAQDYADSRGSGIISHKSYGPPSGLVQGGVSLCPRLPHQDRSFPIFLTFKYFTSINHEAATSNAFARITAQTRIVRNY